MWTSLARVRRNNTTPEQALVLDDVSKRIIEQLQQDGRRPYGAIGKAVGLGDTALTIFNIAKWPVLLVVVMVMLAILYYSAPNAKLPAFKWISPGSVVAVVIWLVASAV